MMTCRNCGRENDAFSLVCDGCGAILGLDLNDGLGANLDAMSQQLDDQLKASQAALDAQLTPFLSAREGGPGGPGGTVAASASAAAAALPSSDWASVLRPRAELIRQSATFALSSSFIQGNYIYRERSGGISFEFLDAPTVNAFATDHAIQIGGDRAIQPPVIIYYAGLASVCRLVAAGVAAYMSAYRARPDPGCAARLVNLFGALGAILYLSDSFELDYTVKIFMELVQPVLPESQDRIISQASSLAAAMDMFVISHEAGHICLGHTLGRSDNQDISRNQEREADSFGSSVLSSSPFRDYLFMGQMFVALVFAWIDATAQRKGGSHPVGRERFMNALICNSEGAKDAAEQFGLTRERFMQLLPPESEGEMRQLVAQRRQPWIKSARAV